MDTTLVETNWADVAKQVVDAGTGMIAEMASMIKGATPELWEILVRQVYAEAITGFIVPLVFFVCCFIFAIGTYRACKNNGWAEDYDIVPSLGVVAAVGAIIFFVQALFNLSDGIAMLINPHYYAIQKFFAIASGGGL